MKTSSDAPSVSVPTAAVCLLLGVAGWVDAVGYIQLGHLFISFMSGTTTQMTVWLGRGEWAKAADAAILIGLFVLGAFFGRLVGIAGGRWQLPVVLGIEAALLGLALLLPTSGALPAATFPAVLAMGWQNGGLQPVAAKVSLTYVTGALVNLARDFADQLAGRTGPGWPKDLSLWLSMALGAAAGGVTFGWLGFQALAVPAGIVLLMAGVAALYRLW